MQLTALVALTLAFATMDVVAKPAPAVDPACAAVERAREAMLAGEVLEPAEANALHASIGRAIPMACPNVRELPFDACEGNAAGIALSALFGAGMDATPIVRAMNNDRCARQILPAVQQASRPTPELRDALFALRDDARWLVLGSVAMNARANGDDVLARSIEDAIARTEPSIATIEAAGNAGCRSCSALFDAASRDSDPWMRRAGAGALRFVPHAARSMCDALERDANATVREHAAWALGFSPEDLALRKSCLAAAASSDASDEVRASAARSLEALSKTTTDSEM